MTPPLTPVDIPAFVARYQAGATLDATARAFGVSRYVGRRVLNDANVPRRGTRPTDPDAAVAAYLAGDSLDRAARAGRMTGSALTSALIARGIRVRGRGEARRIDFTPTQVADAVERYRDGASTRAIGRLLHCSATVVARALRDVGVGPRDRGSNQRGPGEFGRFTDAQGYVHVGLLPEHPRHDMANAADYVLQHRLVMALALGRALTSRETVHHTDGDRAHNDLSNLQLRNGHHGQGIALICHDCGSHNIAPAPLPAEPTARLELVEPVAS